MAIILQNYLATLLETICCAIFFGIFETQEEKAEKTRRIRFFLLFLLSVLSYVYTSAFDRYYLLRRILIIFLFTIMMMMYTDWKFGKTFVLSAIFDSVVLVADLVVLLARRYFLLSGVMERTVEMLFLILSKSVLFLFIFLLYRIFSNNQTSYIREKDWLLFLVMPVFSIAILMAAIKKIELMEKLGLFYFFWFISFGLICINVLMFYFMQNIGKREVLLKEKALLELESKNLMQLYRTISASTRSQRKLSHEYKNQILCMQALCETNDYERLKAYLREISGITMSASGCIDTNHAFANAVFNAKYEEAAGKDILMVCHIGDLSGISLPSSDLVLLLSNLLDNAIEACEKCRYKKMIKIKCIHEEEEFIFSIRNTYNGILNQQGEALYTTKTKNEGEHGIGLENVIKVIKNNHGYYTIEHSETEFYISVIIPDRKLPY